MTQIDDASTGGASGDLTEVADADLVLRTRSGSSHAFAELWRRHYRSGITVARSVTSSLDADDLVQEAYTRIYQSILKGGGPTGSFRAYLFTSIRNTAAGWGRARRESTIDDLETVEDPASSEQATDDALDRSITAQAFRSLPTRWQEVLWYSEIEQMKPAEIAPLLGMKATAVAQLAFRAREGLREAWIQAHLRTVEDGSPCAWTIERLGAYARNNLGARDRTKLEKHLIECARCSIVAAEAKDVSNRLALVLVPLTVGVAGTATYLASLQAGAVPIAAVAAMPSSVVQGAVTVGPMGDGGASSAVAGGAGSTAGGSAPLVGAAAAATGVAGGFGTIIGVAAGAVVIAGTAVAAVMAPGLLRPPPEMPAAVEEVPAGDGPNDGSVLPDDGGGTLVDDPIVLPPAGPDPGAVPPLDDGPQVPDADAPAPVVPPADPKPSEPAPTDPVVPQPPVEPTEPTEPTPPTEPTDPTPPTEPTDPTDPTSPEAPALPDGSPSVADSTWFFDGTELNISITVTAAPGSTVEATIWGRVRATATADENGSAVLTVRPTALQILADANVRIHYVAGDDAGPDTVVEISDLID